MQYFDMYDGSVGGTQIALPGQVPVVEPAAGEQAWLWVPQVAGEIVGISLLAVHEPPATAPEIVKYPALVLPPQIKRSVDTSVQDPEAKSVPPNEQGIVHIESE